MPAPPGDQLRRRRMALLCIRALVDAVGSAKCAPKFQEAPSPRFLTLEQGQNPGSVHQGGRVILRRPIAIARLAALRHDVPEDAA